MPHSDVLADIIGELRNGRVDENHVSLALYLDLGLHLGVPVLAAVSGRLYRARIQHEWVLLCGYNQWVESPASSTVPVGQRWT